MYYNFAFCLLGEKRAKYASFEKNNDESYGNAHKAN